MEIWRVLFSGFIDFPPLICKSGMENWEELHEYVLLHIFQFLETKEIEKVALVCRR